MTTVEAAEHAPLLDRAPQRDRRIGLTIEVGVHPRYGFRLVRLEGELDSSTTSDLALVLSTVLGDGFVAAVIDLGGLEFVDLGGARMIAAASVLFRKRGGEVVLLSPRAAVSRTLRLIGIEHLIHDAAEYTSVLSGFAVAEAISLSAGLIQPIDDGARERERARAHRTSLVVRAKRASAALHAS